jgi:hypothetical protein
VLIPEIGSMVFQKKLKKPTFLSCNRMEVGFQSFLRANKPPGRFDGTQRVI